MSYCMCLSPNTAFFSGAGGRGRTDTVSLPPDFESGTSANSITPANYQRIILYHKIWYKVNTFEKKYFNNIENYLRFCGGNLRLVHLQGFEPGTH